MVILFGLVAIVLLALFGAIPLMLGSAILHEFFPVVPAFSFVQSLILMWLWNSLFGRLKTPEST